MRRWLRGRSSRGWLRGAPHADDLPEPDSADLRWQIHRFQARLGSEIVKKLRIAWAVLAIPGILLALSLILNVGGRVFAIFRGFRLLYPLVYAAIAFYVSKAKAAAVAEADGNVSLLVSAGLCCVVSLRACLRRCRLTPHRPTAGERAVLPLARGDPHRPAG